MVQDSGWYVATTKMTSSCPNVKDSIYVKMKKNPTIITESIIYAELGQMILIKVNSDATNFNWFPNKYLSCYDCQNPILEATTNIKYLVTAKNDFCESSKFIEVIVNMDCAMLVPNVFTPNGDNTNDVFRVITKCDPLKFDMSIYNRWGEKVFYSNSISNYWDGKYLGEDCPIGTYICYIKAIYNDKPEFKSMSNITLLR